MTAVTTAVPTLSQIQAWSTVHLETAAAHWTDTAETWEQAFTSVHRGTLSPDGTTWEGEGAEAAQERTFADLVKVRGLADALYQAESLARHAASELEFAKTRALDAVREAETVGFTVGEDLSVSDSVLLGSLRVGQAEEHAETIAARASELSALDKKIAGKITTALAGVDSAQFGDTPVASAKNEPEIQAVDFKQDPPPPPPGPNADDIRGVLDKLPVGDNPRVRVVKSQQDLDNLWNWLKQTGVERPGNYGDNPGEMITLPDGTIVGRRVAADSTGRPALDVRVPGKDGYIKVHINPTEGGVPQIPTIGEPVVPKSPPAEAPKPPPIEPPKPPPVEPLPRAGGIPIGGAPGTPIGPTLVPPPHSIHHLPILGEDDPDAPWEYEP